MTVSEETHCRHMGYSFRLTARVLLYAPSHRQGSTYHSLWYTILGALAGQGSTYHNLCYTSLGALAGQGSTYHSLYYTSRGALAGQGSTYHNLCYTSRWGLAGTRASIGCETLCVRRTLSGWNEREYRLWDSVCKTYIIWLERERVSTVRVCVWDVHYLAGTRASIGCESLCVRRTLSGWNEREYRLWESVCETYIIWLERERVSAVRLCV